MDRKTLMYLEQRSTKARSIVNRIEKLTKEIEDAKKTYIIRFYTKGNGEIDVGENSKNQAPSYYRSELAARLVNVFIDMNLAEITRLEKELAEL